MERKQEKIELIELGTASIETKGPPGEDPDIVGRRFAAGISAE